MAKLFANSGDPDQTPRSATSDLGLHCLPITILGVSSLKWDNIKDYIIPFASMFYIFYRFCRILSSHPLPHFPIVHHNYRGITILFLTKSVCDITPALYCIIVDQVKTAEHFSGPEFYPFNNFYLFY